MHDWRIRSYDHRDPASPCSVANEENNYAVDFVNIALTLEIVKTVKLH